MATATKQAKKAKGKATDLIESLDFSTVGKTTVDRANAIIPHVKVLGKFSTNKHGWPGIEGTVYELPAMEQAKELLESGVGCNVSMGHPPKDNPNAERKPGEPNGVLFNPRIEGGELYADWQLIPSNQLTSQILDCAENERLNGQYALSINARGYGNIRNNRYCITEFQAPFIRGVDCVTRGGACRTLFESQEHTMKKAFKDIVANPPADAPKDVAKRWTDLLEMYEDMGDMAVDEKEPVADAEPMNWKAHLGNLLKAIAEDPEMTPEEIHKKITAALKCLQEEKANEGEEGAVEVEEGDEEEKDAMESKEREELTQLRLEKGVRDLCESKEYGFTPDSLQLAMLCGLKTDTLRKKAIEQFKGVKKQQSGPRTASGRDVYESRASVGATKLDFTDRTPEARQKRLSVFKIA